jgi:hypothetical protein
MPEDSDSLDPRSFESLSTWDDVPPLSPSRLRESLSEEESDGNAPSDVAPGAEAFRAAVPEEERPGSRVGVTPKRPAALELLRRAHGHRASWAEVYRRALAFYLEAALRKGRLEEQPEESPAPEEEASDSEGASERIVSEAEELGSIAGPAKNLQQSSAPQGEGPHGTE